MRVIGGILLLIGLWLSPLLVFKARIKPPPAAATKNEFSGQLLGSFRVTSYRSVKNQTDNSPNWSSIGIHTNPWMLAVSRDFLRDGRLSYNDVVYIEDIGYKIVGDVMNARYKNRLDVWVESYDKEKAFHTKFKNRKLQVWLIKRGQE